MRQRLPRHFPADTFRLAAEGPASSGVDSDRRLGTAGAVVEVPVRSRGLEALGALLF